MELKFFLWISRANIFIKKKLQETPKRVYIKYTEGT